MTTLNTPTKHLPADRATGRHGGVGGGLAASCNPSDITTAAIAEHMQVTQGALFRHFPSKDAIWEATMGWVAERLLSRIDRAAKGIASPLAAMEAMFMSHVEFVVAHPGVPRMMFGGVAAGRVDAGQAHGADLDPALR